MRLERFDILPSWVGEGKVSPFAWQRWRLKRGESKKNVLDGRRSHLSSSHPSHPSDSRASPPLLPPPKHRNPLTDSRRTSEGPPVPRQSPSCRGLLLLAGRRRRRAPDAAAGPLGPRRQVAAAAPPLPRPAAQRRHQQARVRSAGAAESDRRDDDRHCAAGEGGGSFFFFAPSTWKKLKNTNKLSL